MDIKKKIDEIVDKIKNDPDLKKEFTKNPVGAVEKLIGVDLPDDQISKVVDGIKAKISIDDIGSKLSGLFGKK